MSEMYLKGQYPDADILLVASSASESGTVTLRQSDKLFLRYNERTVSTTTGGTTM